MPFDFPADPTQGLEFQPPGGPLYVYNAPRWVVKTPVIVWDDITLKPVDFPPSPHTHPQSEITNLVGDMALKAPIASPAFTGDPQAPTPATSDNDTSIATTAYVKSNVALISQFPEAPSDGKVYGRKDGTWSTVVGGATVSTTPPTGAKIQGQLWYESDSGNTYLWYEDANSQQWVQQNIQPAGLPDDGEGAGIGEAPSDGLTYGRKDLNWVLLGFAAGGAPAWEDILYKPDTFPPTLPIAQSGITNLTTDLGTKVAKAGDTMTGTLNLPQGSVTANAITFGAGAGSGFFATGTGATTVLNAAVNSVSIMQIAADRIQTSAQFRSMGGTIAAPGISFSAESSSGWYWAASGNVRMVMGGTLISQHTTAGQTTTYFGPVILSADPTVALGAATKQMVDGKASSVHGHSQAEITNLITDLEAKAPLANPALTGTVTAPTPTLGDNSTLVATTAFVAAGFVTPAALASGLSPKAPIDSPAFTGTPTVAADPGVALGIATKQMVDLKLASIVRIVTSTSGTYTKPAGLKFLKVTAVGGGGGGSSAALTAAANSSAGGAGGGAGTVIKIYAASALAATTAYTVGAGGVVTSGSGTAGGSTTFSGLTASGGGAAEATGVNGSASGATQAYSTPGAGGAAAGGDYNIIGGVGSFGIRVFAAVAGNAMCSVGGLSHLSTSNQYGMRIITTTLAGIAGRAYGGGGSGGTNGVSQAAAAAGGAGGAGVIIFEEYY